MPRESKPPSLRRIVRAVDRRYLHWLHADIRLDIAQFILRRERRARGRRAR